MRFVKIPVLCLSAVFLLTGCSGGNKGKDKGAGAREEWTKSLEDSLRTVEDDIVEATSGISRMRVDVCLMTDRLR